MLYYVRLLTHKVYVNRGNFRSLGRFVRHPDRNAYIRRTKSVQYISPLLGRYFCFGLGAPCKCKNQTERSYKQYSSGYLFHTCLRMTQYYHRHIFCQDKRRPKNKNKDIKKASTCKLKSFSKSTILEFRHLQRERNLRPCSKARIFRQASYRKATLILPRSSNRLFFFVAVFILESVIPPKIRGRIIQNLQPYR